MTFTFLPSLTAYDPQTTAEGSIDPLGLYVISERLASALIPGLRERMKHPRYLTAVAVGQVICQEFDEDQVAADGQSAPWLVYEWLVVQALIKGNKGNSEILGLPGSLKARRALDLDQPLSASNYLKNPGTFGFHGVYRTLATDLNLVGHHQLGENGHRLVQVWEKEQGLQGFSSGNTGPGAEFRKMVAQAITGCLKTGVSEKWNWKGLRQIADLLNPTRIGLEEGRVISQMLENDAKGYRKSTLEFLQVEGLTVLRDGGELFFHQQLLANSSGSLALHLKAVLAYERFSRLLQNAWEEVLVHLSTSVTKLHLTEMVSLEAVKKASEEIHGAWQEATKELEVIQQHGTFSNHFSCFGQPLNEEQFIKQLLEHHQKIQKAKPPFGKKPWVEDWSNGFFSIRPAYARKESTKDYFKYVNAYRSYSLASFLIDLSYGPVTVS